MGDFFASSEFIFVRFQHSHGMIFEFGRVAHTVFEQHGFFVDEFDLGFDLIILFFHEGKNIFESCDFFVLLSSFGFGLDLESVFFFENEVNFNGASLLSQGFFVHFDFLFEFFVLKFELFAGVHRLIEN